MVGFSDAAWFLHNTPSEKSDGVLCLGEFKCG